MLLKAKANSGKISMTCCPYPLIADRGFSLFGPSHSPRDGPKDMMSGSIRGGTWGLCSEGELWHKVPDLLPRYLEPQRTELHTRVCLGLTLPIISVEKVVSRSRRAHFCHSLLPTLHSSHRKLLPFPAHAAGLLCAMFAWPEINHLKCLNLHFFFYRMGIMVLAQKVTYQKNYKRSPALCLKGLFPPGE